MFCEHAGLFMQIVPFIEPKRTLPLKCAALLLAEPALPLNNSGE